MLTIYVVGNCFYSTLFHCFSFFRKEDFGVGGDGGGLLTIHSKRYEGDEKLFCKKSRIVIH